MAEVLKSVGFGALRVCASRYVWLQAEGLLGREESWAFCFMHKRDGFASFIEFMDCRGSGIRAPGLVENVSHARASLDRDFWGLSVEWTHIGVDPIVASPELTAKSLPYRPEVRKGFRNQMPNKP